MSPVKINRMQVDSTLDKDNKIVGHRSRGFKSLPRAQLINQSINLKKGGQLSYQRDAVNNVISGRLLVMFYKLLLLSVWGCLGLGDEEELMLMARGRSGPLARYESYSDAVVMRFDVPEEVAFASFAFQAAEEDLSIFGCTPRDVSVRLKQGAPPAVNPDGAPFPPEFKPIPRPRIYPIDFRSDNQPAYVNLTSPEPGAYYAAVFLAYEDPRRQKITQQGLARSCSARLIASVYVRKIPQPTLLADDKAVAVRGRPNRTEFLTFHVPDGVDNVLIDVDVDVARSTVRLAARRPPSGDSWLFERHLDGSRHFRAVVPTLPRTKYYVSLDFDSDVALTFKLRHLPTQHLTDYVTQTYGNVTLYNVTFGRKTLRAYSLSAVEPYKEFALKRASTADSFAYSYELDLDVTVPVNVTAQELIVLKFTLYDNSDVGGTLQYILAFKPRVQRRNGRVVLADEPDDHVLVGCLQRNQMAVPTWPNNCVSSTNTSTAPLVLNSTITNATLLVPYPESGTWYATFKLFCGTPHDCRNCTNQCQTEYEKCTVQCHLNCTNCRNNCTKTCSADACGDCDCARNESSACASSIVFDVSSRPCYYGACGQQGRCGVMVSEGFAYSTCLCSNNYRGFDCSDGSLATPYRLVLLEFLLLVLSNAFFLPAVYAARKRGYPVEALAYLSVFLSSTFYHACDAGENLLSFCIVRLAALQFADFFSAVLSVWLTLLAMADLTHARLSVLQMTGSSVIAFCVTLNRYALWIFALPTCTGLAVIVVSWYAKYRKFRGKFVNRNYLRLRLPVGCGVVAVGLIVYGLLQTQSNYKYLHSLWHVTMAAGVFLLLPARGTFLSSHSSVGIEETLN